MGFLSAFESHLKAETQTSFLYKAKFRNLFLDINLRRSRCLYWVSAYNIHVSRSLITCFLIRNSSQGVFCNLQNWLNFTSSSIGKLIKCHMSHLTGLIWWCPHLNLLFRNKLWVRSNTNKSILKFFYRRSNFFIPGPCSIIFLARNSFGLANHKTVLRLLV